jgi:hypothetical protein
VNTIAFPGLLRKSLVIIGGLALTACVTTPRLYTQQELGSLAQSCGYALGEIIQDEEEKRLLLVLTAVQTTQAEQQCIRRWARPRHLHVVYAQVKVPE